MFIAIVPLNADVVDASHRRSNQSCLEVLLKGALVSMKQQAKMNGSPKIVRKVQKF